MKTNQKKFPTAANIAGSKGVFGGKQPKSPKEDPDSLSSRAMVSIVDLISEGRIGGLVDGAKSIYLDDTPLQNADGTMNFEGFAWDFRDGAQLQKSLGDKFDAVETPVIVGTQVKKATPAVVTITNPNVDQVRMITAVGALMRQFEKSGNIAGTSVKFRFEVSYNGGSFSIVGGTKTISGKSRSRFQRAYLIKLARTVGSVPVTSTTIRMVRETADSADTKMQNDLFLDSYSEIVSTKMAYPNSALVGVSIDSAQFSTVPTRHYHVHGILIKVPTNYNHVTREYTGNWNGTFKLASSDNPAWILYDVITSNRYGLGDLISRSSLNIGKLYEIGRYCDALIDDGFGKKEPRFTINTAITNAVEAYRLIMDISSVFNGMTYWSGATADFMYDAPMEPVMLFNNANVVGDFGRAGADLKDRHTVVLVTWNDPEQNYRQTVEYVEDEQLIKAYGYRKAEIVAFGCCSRGQAVRVGKWLLYTERFQSEVINFTVGLDAALVLPGDIIKIHDQHRTGKRVSGRLKNFAPLQAELDSKHATLEANSTISIRLANGQFVNRLITSIVQNASGTTTVKWALGVTDAVVPNAIWIIATPNLKPELARVVALNGGDTPGTLNVTAIPHNPNKYLAIENNIVLEQPKTSVLERKAQVAPASMTITQNASVVQGINVTTMMLSWEQALGAVAYRVAYKKDDGNWIEQPQTGALSIDIENVYEGQYLAKVVAISPTDAESIAVHSVLTDVGGKTTPLPAVSGLIVTGELFGMRIDWGFPVTGAADAAYTEVRYAPEPVEGIATTLGLFAYPTNTATQQGLQGGLTLHYQARIIDRLGNKGPWSTWVSGTTSQDASAVLDILQGEITSSALGQELAGKIEQISTNSQAIVDEALSRANADAQEATARANAIAAEATSRTTAITTAISSEVTRTTTAIGVETTARAAAITKEVKDRNAAILVETNARGTAIAAEVTRTTTAIGVETTARAAAITKEVDDRNAAVLVETNARKAALTAEATARGAAITVETDARSAAIAAETDARTNAVSQLQNGITNEATTRIAGDKVNADALINYKSSNDTALANIQQTINTAVSNGNTSATAITALDGRLVANENKAAANASAVSQINTTIAAQGTNITNQSSQITSLTNLVDSDRDSDSLAADYLMKNPLSWDSHYGRDLTPNFVTTETGKVSKWVMRRNASDGVSGFWNYNNSRLPSGKKYRVSVWIRRSTDATGAIHLIRSNVNLANVRIAEGYANQTVTVPTDERWYQVTAVFDVTSNTYPMNCFGIAINHPSGAGWAEAQGFRVSEIIGASDIDSTIATSAALSTLDSKVTTIDGKVTSQGTQITTLNNSLTALTTDVSKKATSATVSALDSKVTTQGNTITSQGGLITGLTNSLSTLSGQVANKAESSALNTLDSKVTQQGADISSQGTQITTLNNSLTALNDKADTKADATALNALDSKVATVDGKVTTNTSNLTALTGRVATTENNIATKADATALNNYYTKTAADAAVAGQITAFDSSLVIGAENLWSIGGSVHTNDLGIGTRTLIDATVDQHRFVIGSFLNGNSRIRNDALLQSGSAAQLIIGEKYTITFKVRASKAGVGNYYAYVGKTGYPRAAIALSLTTEWQTIVHTFDLTADAISSTSQLFGIGATSPSFAVGDWYEVKELMLQRGSKATSYVKAQAITQNALSANASAISTTNAEVTRVNGVVVSQSGLITQLRNDLTTTNTNVGTKASAASLDALTNTVTQQGGTLTSQGTKVTSLENSLSTLTGTVDTKATTTALNALDSKVTGVDGRVTANSGSITSLAARVTTTEGNIATKADATALNNYYTKAQADTATAGKVSEFKATLKSGGDNLLIASNTPLVKAVGASAYLIGGYVAGEDLRGRTMTVVACISVDRGTTTTGELYAWQGSGVMMKFDNFTSQTKSSTKAIVHLTAAWNTGASIPNGNTLNFYWYPNNTETSKPVAVTVHWAAIYEGEVVPTAAWEQSPYDTKALLDANATAISSTNTEVSRVNGVVTSQGQDITQLKNNVTTINGNIATKADATALSTLDNKVTVVDGRVTSNSNSITALDNSLSSLTGEVATKASSAALSSLGGTVTQQGDTITSQSGQLTTLNNSLSALTGTVNAKADSSALSALDSKVTTQGGQIASQGTAVTKLDNQVSNIGGKNIWSLKSAAFVNERGATARTAIDELNEHYRFAPTSFVTNSALARNDSMLVANAASELTQGASYVLSFKIRASKTASIAYYAYVGKANSPSTAITLSLTTEWLEVVVRFVLGGLGFNSTSQMLGFSASSTQFAAGDWYEVKEVSLQKGEVKTNFSPAPQLFNVELGTKATSSALTALDSKVTTQGSTITSQGGQITTLNNSLGTLTTTVGTKANSSALTALDSKVTGIDGRVTTNSSSITSLNNSLSTLTGTVNTKADSSALTTLDNKVTTVDGKVTTQAGQITTLQGNVTTINNNVAQKADSSTVSALDSKVTTQGNDLTTQSGQITTLNNEISNINLRGMDLVSNGLAQLGSNKFWSTFGFDATDRPTGLGSFLIGSGITSRTGDEFIPVDPSRTYKLAYQLRQRGAGVEGRAYGCVMPIDSDKNIISPSHYMAQTNTLTKLAAALTPGDTVMVLQDASAWAKTGATHLLSAIFWNYVDGSGYAWPANTYSRNYYGNLYIAGAVSGNTVTLRTPWVGPTIAVGTDVSNGSSGGNYMYIGASNTIIPEVWTEYGGEFGGIHPSGINANATTKLPMAAAFVKIGWLANRATSGGYAAGSITAVAAVSLRDWSAAKDPSLASASALTALDNKVTTVDGKVTTNSSSITALNNALTTTNNNVATKANSSALTALDNKVTLIDGRVVANANSITTLNSDVALVNGELVKKVNATALSNYYTQAEADTAISGKVEEFSAKLGTSSANIAAQLYVVAGDNIVNHTNGVTTPTANHVLYSEMPAIAGSTYYFAASSDALRDLRYAFFDIDKAFISGSVRGGNTYENLVLAPPGAKYLSISYNRTAYPNCLPMVANSSKPTPYVTPETDSKTLMTATASGLNTLSTTVSDIGGTVSSHTQSINSLAGSVGAINGALTTKADTSALASYYTKGEANSAITGKIEAFEAKLSTDSSNMAAESFMQIDKIVTHTTGVIADASTHVLFSQMPARAGSEYYVAMQANGLRDFRHAFFDAARQYISGTYHGTDNAALLLSAPANAAYISVSFNFAFYNSKKIMVANSSKPVGYFAPYDDIIGSVESSATAITNVYTKADTISAISDRINEYKASYDPGNLLPDPYFYKFGLGGADGWGSSLGAFTQITVNDDSYVVTKKPYIRYANISLGGLGSKAFAGEVSSNFNCVEDSSYDCTLSVRKQSSGSMGLLQVYVAFYNAANAVIANYLLGVMQPNEINGKFSNAVKAPLGSVRGLIRLRAEADTSGIFAANYLSIYDVSVTKVGAEKFIANTLVNYYNKADADSAIAGKVEQFTAEMGSGSNLLRNTEKPSTINIWNSPDTNSNDWYTSWPLSPVRRFFSKAVTDKIIGFATNGTLDKTRFVAGKTYTLSFRTGYVGVFNHIYITDGGANERQLPNLSIASHDWQIRRSMTFVAPITVDGYFVLAIRKNWSNNEQVEIAELKVEEGATATAWNINPKETAAVEIKATATADAVTGLSTQYTVKLDVNGYVSGFGMANTGKLSNFVVNADMFAIGAPSGAAGVEYPFIFRASPYTDPATGRVFPRGAYLREAFIDRASINLAHINKASIGSLSAVSATIGLFKSSTGNKRVEISDNGFKMFDDAGVLRIELGDF